MIVALAVSSDSAADANAAAAARAPFEIAMETPDGASALSARPAPMKPGVNDAWTRDRSETRPAALPAMYASLGVLQILDVVSTRQAVQTSRAHEVNLVMRGVAGNSAAMMGVKVASTAATIFFTERAWKKNRKSAVVAMVIANGITAAVSARNLRNAK
jgi:hypothetical protein